MGVRLRVQEVAKERGIRDATALAARAEIAYATAYKLWKGDIGGKGNDGRSVGLLTIHRVARALGVKMSDLYVEEDRLTLYAAVA